MESNLVELKYDKVNEYFEKFKKKYTSDYAQNKIKGYRTAFPYHMLVGPFIMSVISVIAVYATSTMSPILSKTNSNDMYEAVSSWVIPMVALVSFSHFLVTFIAMMLSSHDEPIFLHKNRLL